MKDIFLASCEGHFHDTMKIEKKSIFWPGPKRKRLDAKHDAILAKKSFDSFSRLVIRDSLNEFPSPIVLNVIFQLKKVFIEVIYSMMMSFVLVYQQLI